MRPLPTTVCCLVVLAALLGCRSSHDQDSFYPLRSDAEKNGEFDRGWLPDFLPKSSRTIHVAYDLSPSHVWCAFEFDAGDAETLLNSVTPVDQLAPAITRVPSPRLNWWPKSLDGNLDVQKIHGAGLALYSAARPVSQLANETLLFALDRTNGRGYFYGH